MYLRGSVNLQLMVGKGDLLQNIPYMKCFINKKKVYRSKYKIIIIVSLALTILKIPNASNI